MAKIDMDELTRLASLATNLSATTAQREKAMHALDVLIARVRAVSETNPNEGDPGVHQKTDLFPDVPTHPVRLEKQHSQSITKLDAIIDDHWHVSDTEWSTVVDEFDSSARVHKNPTDQRKRNARDAVPELKSVGDKSKSTSQDKDAKTILSSVWNTLRFWKAPYSEQKALDSIQQGLQEVKASIEKLHDAKTEKKPHRSRHHTKPVEGNLNLEERLKDLKNESKSRHHRTKSVEDNLNLEERLQALKK